MLRIVTAFYCCLVFVLSTVPAWASTTFVVFSLNSDLPELNKSQVKMLYRGKLNQIGGFPVTLADLPDAQPERVAFYHHLLRKDPTQMKTIWAKQTFSGRTRPPIQLDRADAAHLLDWLRRHPYGVAYHHADAVPNNVNVLFTFEVEESP